MSTYLGACRELDPADIDEDAVASAALTYIEGYMWDAGGSKAAIRKAIAAAKGAGRKIAMTLSDPFCVGRFREEFLELMERDVDILFANEAEITSLYEVEEFDEALQRARKWRGLAAMTRSEKVRGRVSLRAVGREGFARLRAAGRDRGVRNHFALRRTAGNVAEDAGGEGRDFVVLSMLDRTTEIPYIANGGRNACLSEIRHTVRNERS
jgi:hypothetical protein